MRKLLFIFLVLLSCHAYCGKSAARIVAAADRSVAAFTTIGPLDVKAIKTTAAEPDAISLRTEEEAIAKTAGSLALVDIPAGTQIKANSIKPKSPARANALPAGYVFYTLEIAKGDALNLYRQNGVFKGYVDLVFKSYKTVNGLREPVVYTFLQRAWAEDVTEADGKYYLLLMVNSKDAPYLFFAERKKAALKITVRSNANATSFPQPITRVKEFFAKGEPDDNV